MGVHPARRAQSPQPEAGVSPVRHGPRSQRDRGRVRGPVAVGRAAVAARDEGRGRPLARDDRRGARNHHAGDGDAARP